MDGQRRDLGELFARLARVVVAAERPVLDGLGVSMREYVVLGGLRDGPAPSQARLAEITGRDTTRLIPLLDGLQRRGLVRRTPDPADRRHRIIELTDDGARLLARCREGIRAVEARLLEPLPADRRAEFVTGLEQVADLLLAGRTGPAGGSG